MAVDISDLSKKIQKFNFLKYCDGFKPSTNHRYVYFAIIVYLTFISIFFLDVRIHMQNLFLVNILQTGLIYIGTFFVWTTIWPPHLTEKYLGILWYSCIFIVFCIFSNLLILLNNFSAISLTIFVIDLLALMLWFKWHTVIAMVITGNYMSYAIYCLFVENIATSNIMNPAVRVHYICLALYFIILNILRQTLLKTKPVKVYPQIARRDKFLSSIVGIEKRIYEHMSEGIELPITKIKDFPKFFRLGLDNYTAKQIRAIGYNVYRNYGKLTVVTQCMIDVMTLYMKKKDITREKVNLSNLVKERLDIFYQQHSHRHQLVFSVNIAQNIVVFGDINCMTQLIDTLIANSLKYTERGMIKVSLRSRKKTDDLVITDTGTPTPRYQLKDMLGVFTTTYSGHISPKWRGIGLPFCRNMMHILGGAMNVDSDGIRGMTFTCSFFDRVPKDS